MSTQIASNSPLAKLESAIVNAVSAGSSAIDAQSLLNAVAEIRRQAELSETSDPLELAARNRQADIQIKVLEDRLATLRDNNRISRAEKHAIDVELFRSVFTYGHAALKSVFLISGGAAAAMLAFLAHLVSDGRGERFVPTIAFAIALFCCSLGLATVAYAATYVTQYFHTLASRETTSLGWQRWTDWASRFQIGVILLFILAMVLFGYGVFTAYRPFQPA